MNEAKIRELIALVDKTFADAGCGVLDALNATSIMSTSLAHSVGLARNEYMNNLEHMFNMTKPLSDTTQTPVEEDENE
jgi:hypothetical protein